MFLKYRVLIESTEVNFLNFSSQYSLRTCILCL